MKNKLIKLLRANLALAAMVVFTTCVGVFFLVRVVIPAWKAPTNKTYASKLGYLALMRKTHQPLPVTTAIVGERTTQRATVGEGMMMSNPVLVPIVPMDRILAVYAQEGQAVKKGDLLLEMDSTKLEIKIQSAKLAISTAEAELARVRIGSAYVLAQERPQKDQIDAETAQKTLTLLDQQLSMAKDLESKGVISKKELIDTQLTMTEPERQLKMAQFDLGMSTKGVVQSELIASNAVDDAKNALAQRMRELEDYKVYAPADGIVQQVIVHAGEYNQETGRPAVVIASGKWFEANVDQNAVNQVKVGDRCEVNLQALGSQPLAGRVKSVVPIISYDAGGPEATRPLRPVGTGAPEWPSTFRVRVELEADSALTAPGMTGFARIVSERSGVAVPQGAVTSLSAGTGIVCVIDGDRHTTREVRCGTPEDGWIEIFSGLSKGEKIATGGQQFLEPQDTIAQTPGTSSAEVR